MQVCGCVPAQIHLPRQAGSDLVEVEGGVQR